MNNACQAAWVVLHSARPWECLFNPHPNSLSSCYNKVCVCVCVCTCIILQAASAQFGLVVRQVVMGVLYLDNDGETFSPPVAI